MDLKTILAIITALAGFVATVAVPTVVKIYVKLKKARAEITQIEADKLAAIAAEEKAKKILEMTEKANEVVVALEKKFAPQDAALKVTTPSSTLGGVKKECALAELSELSRRINLDFDRAEWGTKIDKIVTLTRNVNARQTDKPAA